MWNGDMCISLELSICAKRCLLIKHVVHITEHNYTVLSDQTDMHITSLPRNEITYDWMLHTSIENRNMT